MKPLCLFPFAAILLLAQPSREPRLTSIFPLTVQRGQSVSAVIRGAHLDQVQSVYFRENGFQARVEKVEPVPEPIPAGAKGPQPQLLHVGLTIATDTKLGPHTLRVVTNQGLSNEIPIRVVDQPVATEPSTPLAIPSIVTGRIATSGEVDEYWIEARAGQEVTLQAISGSKTLDPSVAIYEPSGSWFDPKRINRLAFNDEPLNFPGLSLNAELDYTFPRAGRYCIRVEAFAGQGGPDAVYELRVTEGKLQHKPSLRPTLSAAWEERELTRNMGEDWMKQISSRGNALPVEAAEIYRAVPEGSQEIPVMKLPGIVEGVIAKAGQTHVIRLQIEKAQETVIEIETPEATTPVFTPVVRLLEPGGQEMVGNLYTRLNNNNLKMMKSVMAKTTFSLFAPGIYTLEIHEITTDHAAPDFRYRVMVRPQIPHLGKFLVQQETLSVERGGTRPVSVRIEREEGFNGLVAIQLENLPTGVTSVLGIENPADRPVLPNAGKVERYQPRVQAASLIVMAAPDAPLSQEPTRVRAVARPIRDGRMGEPIASADILLVVVNKK
ncbi:hypothetical protein [Bryobacter aggregatus]|uniref:hypothetical protein n=1 Tax=Bryobacter aggregatus TaxID=360054 RepID=UPI0004E14F32|nr:hypothetical protein [Bryobacter aggregatus]